MRGTTISLTTMMTMLAGMASFAADSPPKTLPAAAPAEPSAPGVREPMVFKDITPHHEHHPDHESVHLDHGGHAPENLFFNVEYLLWRPRRAAFDFALSDSNRDLVPSGRVQSLNYELRSGVRAGLSYRIGESAWFADGAYTYYRSSAGRAIAAPAGGTLYATLTRPGLTDEATTANANASLEFNLYDGSVSRWIAIDEHAGLKVFGGVRWASVSDKFEATYDGGDANQALVRTRTRLEGFGPLVGGEVTARLHGGFHVFGRGTASLLTGTFKNSLQETNTAGLTTYADIESSTRRVIPTLGLAIGGGWQHSNVSIRAGYEITNFFGFYDSPRITGELSEGKFTTRPGNLSLEGLFVQLGVAY
jgi:hypothetical protein